MMEETKSRMRPLAAVRVASLLRLAALAGPALAFTLASAPEVALAQAKKPPAKDPKTAEAKKLFDEGSDAYADGRYEDAVKAWEKSYELSGKPLIFESIGNAYERLGDKKKARDYLSKWRAEAPPAEHEQLDARIKNLDSRIAAAEAAEAERKAQDEKKKAGTDAADKAKKEEAKARDEARSTRLVAGIAVGGAGVLAVGAGIVMGAVGAGQRPDPNTVCSESGDRTLCRASARGAIEGSSTLALAGDITWIAGAVLAATGGVLILTMPGPAEPAAKGKESSRPLLPRRWVSVTPVVGAGSGGIGVRGAF